MNKIENVVANVIKEIKGKMIGFEINNQKIQKQIEKNDLIVECCLLNHTNSSSKNGGFGVKGKNKMVQYKKICKKFGKKKYDMVFGNYDLLGSYRRRFIFDSIYLAKNSIYIMVGNDYIDSVFKRYQRYNVVLHKIECKDGFLITVELKDTKVHWVRSKMYLFLDYLYDIVDIIGDILVK